MISKARGTPYCNRVKTLVAREWQRDIAASLGIETADILLLEAQYQFDDTFNDTSILLLNISLYRGLKLALLLISIAQWGLLTLTSRAYRLVRLSTPNRLTHRHTSRLRLQKLVSTIRLRNWHASKYVSTGK